MPLRTLYLDMNSFFASVEQQLRPELRRKPVLVAALNTPHTVAIAASPEAKSLGFPSGTPIWKARQNKQIHIIEARPEVYVRTHHALRRAVETILPLAAVHSIDELSCHLAANQSDPQTALTLAQKIKHAIYEHVGHHLHCSIGLAPNPFLAKIAADMQKPNGLTLLSDHHLPHALHPLPLSDLPGIGLRMLPRLASFGITTTKQLCDLSESQLQKIWASTLGQQFWHDLHGFNLPSSPTHHSTVSHSHVLPPNLRTLDGAKSILIRLLHKAAARLRKLNHTANALEIYLSFTFLEEGFRATLPLNHCNDTLTLLEAFESHWHPPFPSTHPTQVAITLYKLTPRRSATLPLFQEQQQRQTLSRTLDTLNQKFGPDTAYFANMHHTINAAPTRISFTQIPEFP